MRRRVRVPCSVDNVAIKTRVVLYRWLRGVWGSSCVQRGTLHMTSKVTSRDVVFTSRLEHVSSNDVSVSTGLTHFSFASMEENR